MVSKEEKYLMLLITIIVIIIFTVFISVTNFLNSFGNFAGGAGSLKSYLYSIPKNKLEVAINYVLKNNSKIYQDTITDDYYNKDGYVTVKITEGNEQNEYTFRYYGGPEEWQKSKTSQIFIVYAHDKDGIGGSEGHGGLNKELKNKLYKVFETEFIKKVDTELKQNHTETE
jgi:flagellar basal body-associated protein FliL